MVGLPLRRKVGRWCLVSIDTSMAVTMVVPKWCRLVYVTVLLAALVLLAGTHQICQAGVLGSGQASPCSLLNALWPSPVHRPAEVPAAAQRQTGEDPATAAFAICMVIKDQAEDLREVRSARRPAFMSQPRRRVRDVPAVRTCQIGAP